MVSWKDKIVDPSVTTVSLFGGKTLNSILDYHSGVDLTVGGTLPGENSDIATETIFKNNTLKLWDSDKSHKITFQTPDYTETKTWTFPNEAALGAADEFMFKDAVQIVTGKTMDFSADNTAQNIPTSALPASIFFTNQDNNIGAHHFDVAEYIGTVASPASGSRRVFTDPSTGKISIRRSDGVILSLEEGNLQFAGGFAAGGTATLSGDGSTTVFTIAHGESQTPPIAIANPASVDANADRKVEVDDTNITITYNTAPPTGTNNLVFIWGVAYVNPDPLTFGPTSIDTFQNKTIPVDQNTINHSTTNIAGDLLKGDGTSFQRLAKGTAFQFLRVNSGATDLEYTNPSGIFDGYFDLSKITAPADPGVDTSRTYLKEVDANNDTIASKYKVNGAVVEVLDF